jgi:small subunit ribosomal protein S6e
VKRPVQREGKKERLKAPKIQRLVTPIVLQVCNLVSELLMMMKCMYVYFMFILYPISYDTFPRDILLNTLFLLQRKRHRLALKKKRCLARKEQAAEYAKLLAQRQKEAKNRRQEEIKRRRSASMRDSKSSNQSTSNQ